MLDTIILYLCFALASIGLFVYSLRTFEEDAKATAIGPLFIMGLAAMLWFISYIMLGAQNSSTSLTQPYNAITSNVPLYCYNSESALITTGANTVNCGTTTETLSMPLQNETIKSVAASGLSADALIIFIPVLSLELFAFAYYWVKRIEAKAHKLETGEE